MPTYFMYDPIFFTNCIRNHPEIYPFVGIELCFIIYYIQVIYTLLKLLTEVIHISICRPH